MELTKTNHGDSTEIYTYTVIKLCHQFYSYSLSQIPVNAVLKAECQETKEWGCAGDVGSVKNRCFGAFTYGKQEVRSMSEGSHLAYGFHWRGMKHECGRLWCQRQETVGVIYAQRQLFQTLYYCVIVHIPVSTKGQVYSLLNQSQSSFFARGSVFEAPFP